MLYEYLESVLKRDLKRPMNFLVCIELSIMSDEYIFLALRYLNFFNLCNKAAYVFPCATAIFEW